MLALINIAIAFLSELVGIRQWLHDREIKKEIKYEQQYSQAKKQLELVKDAKDIQNEVLNGPDGSANKWLHGDNSD